MDEFSMLWSAQGGVFTTAQAAWVGVGREALSQAVRRGAVRRLARGLYAVGPQPATAELRHLELCRALLVEYPDAVLAGRSAAVAMGLPLWRVPLSSALLHRPVTRQVRRSGAVIRPLETSGAQVVTTTGPATAPARTAVQVALDHGAVPGVVCADAALHRGLLTDDTLGSELARRQGHRRIQHAVAMSRLVDAGAESPGESRLRVTLTMGGIGVESQFVVRDGRGGFVGRADFRVAGTNVLVEFDGLVKYTDGGVEALVREKRREDRLRALGWVVVRFVWADLEHPARVVAAVLRAVDVSERLAARAG
jgi:very-short-patch-repair endonuclease